MTNKELLNQMPIDAAAVLISLIRLTGLLKPWRGYSYLQCISMYCCHQAPWC